MKYTAPIRQKPAQRKMNHLAANGRVSQETVMTNAASGGIYDPSELSKARKKSPPSFQ
jgi:hypothetical protein